MQCNDVNFITFAHSVGDEDLIDIRFISHFNKP